MNAEQAQSTVNGRDCIHGQLARSCNICDLEQEVANQAQTIAMLIEQLASVPVLTVECEPDYWSGGHYHEGTMTYIDPTAVWKLPIGTKLYTAPPAPSVPDAELVRDAELIQRLIDGLPEATDGAVSMRMAVIKYLEAERDLKKRST